MQIRSLISLLFFLASLQVFAQQKTFQWTDTEFEPGSVRVMHFLFDGSRLSSNEPFDIFPANEEVLDSLINFLRNNPELNVEIGGHTDDLGHERYNKHLSERRARTICLRLIEEGITPERLVWRGYGEEKPMYKASELRGVPDSEAEEVARRLNRRAEVKIL